MRGKRLSVSKSQLQQWYQVEHKTQREISLILNCTVAAISLQLRKYGLRKIARDIYLGKTFGRLTPIEVSGSCGGGD